LATDYFNTLRLLAYPKKAQTGTDRIGEPTQSPNQIMASQTITSRTTKAQLLSILAETKASLSTVKEERTSALVIAGVFFLLGLLF
jgi:hypothetical protein